MEIKKFAPAFKILTYFGTQKERRLKRTGWSKTNAFHICITSYKLVIQDQAAFRRKKWKYLVLDEAHHIKNFRSQRWQTLLNFNSKRRLLLTGTPLQNNLMELWSLLHFLMPHIFESHKEFKDWFSNPVTGMIEGTETVNQDIIERLHKILRPFLLRRLKKDVEKSLKDKIEHVIPCPLSKRQRLLYEDFMASGQTRDTLGSGSFLGIMNVLMQLRKVCNHPDLFEERPIRSPHEMQPLVMQTAGFVLTALDNGPLASEVHLDLLNLNLASYCELDSYDAVRTFTLRTRPQLITEVSSRRLGADGSESSVPALPSLLPTVSPLRAVLLAQQERRLAWRKGVRTHMAFINEKRCTRVPMYSHGMRRSVHVQLTTARLHAYGAAEVAPLEVPTAMHGLSLSFERRYEGMQADLEAFATQIVKARAPPLRLSTRHDPSEAAAARARLGLVARLPQERATLMQPVLVRQSLFFPDKRLIQWDCGKLQVLDNLLRQLQRDEHRCLIFTQMTKMLNVLESWINIAGYTYLRLDGATKTEDRQKLMDRFNGSTKYFIFILATRAGGLGINLTGADTVIFYDSDWNPTIDLQAQDRAHRIGQTKQVTIYRLVSESTVEENILRKSNQKRLLDSVVIQSGGFTTDFFKEGTKGVLDLFEQPEGAEPAADSAAAPAPRPAAAEVEAAAGKAAGKKGKAEGKAAGKRGKKEAAAEASSGKEAAAGGKGGKGVEASSGATKRAQDVSAEEMEQAMLVGQDAEDVEMMQSEQAQQARDNAEFDESVPFLEDGDEGAGGKAGAGTDGGETTDGGATTDGGRRAKKASAGAPSTSAAAAAGSSQPLAVGASGAQPAAAGAAQVDQELLADFGEVAEGGNPTSVVQRLEAALTPVQRYMLRFVEEVFAAYTAQQEAALGFEQEEWQLGAMRKQQEEVEAAADEEDEVLFYEVREAPPSQGFGEGKAGGRKGRKGGGGAKGSQAEGSGEQGGRSAQEAALANASVYLQQQAAASGLELTAELQDLEMQLWGPPAPPDADEDELYVSAPGFSSDDDGVGGRGGQLVSLQFSGLVTEGAQGVQRVRASISERKRLSREGRSDDEGGLVGDRRSRRDAMRARQMARQSEADVRAGGGSGARMSTRKRHAPFRMDDEDDGWDEPLDDELDMPGGGGGQDGRGGSGGGGGGSGGAPGDRDRRSHKKRRPEGGLGGRRDEFGGSSAPRSGYMPSSRDAAAVLAQRGAGKAGIGGLAGRGRKAEEITRPMDTMWAPEEDAALLKAIHAFGNANWELVADVLSSLIPTRHRSAKACYERCSHVLLPRDEAPREPGTLHTEVALHSTSGRDPPGSLSSLPQHALCPPPPPAQLDAGLADRGSIGEGMRRAEAARGASMPQTAQQAAISTLTLALTLTLTLASPLTLTLTLTLT